MDRRRNKQSWRLATASPIGIAAGIVVTELLSGTRNNKIENICRWAQKCCICGSAIILTLFLSTCFLPSNVYAITDPIVYFEDEDVVIELGETTNVIFTITNPRDTNNIYTLYAGSTDPGFRYWVWFDNERYSSSKNIRTVYLLPYETETININVLAGKTGVYPLIIGPDGKSAQDAYASKDIHIVRKDDNSLSSTSPDLSGTSIIITAICSIIILMTKGNKSIVFQGR